MASGRLTLRGVGILCMIAHGPAGGRLTVSVHSSTNGAEVLTMGAHTSADSAEVLTAGGK